MSDVHPRKRRMLFLCQTLPFPPDGGVNIRTFNVLRVLAREYEVDALCFYRKSDRQTSGAVERGIAGLEPYARVEAFPIPQEHSRLRLVWDHFRSLIALRPYTHFAYASRAFSRRMRQLMAATEYDVVHLDSLDLDYYLSGMDLKRVACTHHNVESRLLRRRADVVKGWRGWYFRIQAWLTERTEQQWANRVALNCAVSPADAAVLRDLSHGARVIVVANGVDVESFQPAVGAKSGLVFVGGTNWFPNRDALDFFTADILPRIRAEIPDVSVTWVGHASERDKRLYGDRYDVNLTGYVDDVRPYIQGAACYVVPLRVGGGTRLKIVDAWAMGAALVTTSVGCEGLDAQSGTNSWVADDPNEFAAAVLRILRDSELMARLGAAARETAVTKYSWDVVAQSLLPPYRALGCVGRGIDAHQLSAVS